MSTSVFLRWAAIERRDGDVIKIANDLVENKIPKEDLVCNSQEITHPTLHRMFLETLVSSLVLKCRFEDATFVARHIDDVIIKTEKLAKIYIAASGAGLFEWIGHDVLKIEGVHRVPNSLSERGNVLWKTAKTLLDQGKDDDAQKVMKFTDDPYAHSCFLREIERVHKALPLPTRHGEE